MAAAAKPNPYASLVGGNVVFAGIDQGIDFTGAGPVYAIGPGQVTRVQPSGSGWPGQGAVLNYLLTGGPAKGHSVYVAEDFTPAAGIAVGSVVTQGQTLGMATGSGQAPGIEIGWANPNGTPVAPLPAPRPASQFTAQGADFLKFIGGGEAAPSTPLTGSPSGLYSPTTGAPLTAQGAYHVSSGSVADQALQPFRDAASFFAWIGNTKNLVRVGEMGAGGLLILVGIVMVGRAASKGSAAGQVAGAASTAAAPVRAVSTVRRARAATAARAQRSAAQEARAAELHTSKVKLNQARATELRTRTKHRRRAKGEQTEAERRSYIRGATDQARNAA